MGEGEGEGKGEGEGRVRVRGWTGMDAGNDSPGCVRAP